MTPQEEMQARADAAIQASRERLGSWGNSTRGWDCKMYDIFVRNWWKRNPSASGGRVPGPGRKTYIARRVSEQEARRICKQYNDTHEPGFLSRKAEYEAR